MINFILTSRLFFILLICSSCSLANYGNLKKIEIPEKEKNKIQIQFLGHFEKALFKTGVDIYGKHFSGLLFIKKMESKIYRIVFISETGFKFLDFSLRENSVIKHFVHDMFQSQRVIKTISKVIKLLLKSSNQNEHFSRYKDRDHGLDVYRFEDKTEDEFNYYFFHSKSKDLIKIENGTSCFKNLIIELKGHSENLPRLIQITHQRINLVIKLRRIS